MAGSFLSPPAAFWPGADIGLALPEGTSHVTVCPTMEDVSGFIFGTCHHHTHTPVGFGTFTYSLAGEALASCEQET